MNFEILKIPAYRRKLYTNTNLDIINDHTNKILKFDDLKYLDDLGVIRINMMHQEIGYFYNPTVTEFVKLFIFGNSSINTHESSIDFNDFSNSIINGKKMTKAFQYRLENLLRSTEAEKIFWNTIFEKQYTRELRTRSSEILDRYNLRKRGFSIIPQSILPVEDSFYIADYVINVHGYKPILIEIDGAYHYQDTQIDYDKNRTEELLEKYSYVLLRFTNDQVINNFDYVFDCILKNLKIEKPKSIDAKFKFHTRKSLLRFLVSNLDNFEYRTFYIKRNVNKYEVSCNSKALKNEQNLKEFDIEEFFTDKLSLSYKYLSLQKVRFLKDKILKDNRWLSI